MTLPVTPSRPTTADQIVAGYFHEKRGYTVYRPHGTVDWLLVQTIRGRGRFGHRDGQIMAEPGDLVLLRPGTLHDYGVDASASRWELIWAHFIPRADWIEWLDWPLEAPGLHRLRIAERAQRTRLLAQFHRVVDATRMAMRRRYTLAMNALELLLLWCDDLNPRSAFARLDPRIREVIDFVCSRFAEPISMEDLADAAGLSVSRMSHLFRQQVGMTPQQFLERQRMRRASELLRFTQRTIQDIARDVGFDDPFYFSTRFRQHTGTTPREYRRQT